VALAATIGLTALKCVAGYLSGSVGVLSEALHSFLDLLSAAVSYFTVREAGKPADEDHPFGHGKIETLSSLLEAVLLLAAAVFIIQEAIEHVLHPRPVEYAGLAIVVIGISLVVSWLVYRHNIRAANDTDSSAIRVNALHFLSDVLASGAVLVGLILLKLTGWLKIDAIMAFIVAGYILVASAQQVKRALRELTDVQLPEPEIRRIKTLIDGFRDKERMPIIDAHDLRTRQSGSTKHIDFHMTVCGHETVHESHVVCDEIEARLREEFPGASVNIHVEPCEHVRVDCHLDCPIYQKLEKSRGNP
jgi:cation diffusion facilitator family transporter